MGMDVKAWQTQLRRQFGRAQSFKVKNIGDEAVFEYSGEDDRSFRLNVTDYSG
jgi:uncharacterized protein YaeQ